MPSEQIRDAAGNILRDDEGKTRYRSTIQCATRELQQRWSDAVCRLILEEYGSGAFDGDDR